MLFTISSYRIVCFLISRTLPPLSSSFFFPYTVIYITSFGDHLLHRPQHRVLPSPLTPLPSPLSPPLLPPLLPPHPSPVPDDVPREPWRSPPAPTLALCPPLSPPPSPLPRLLPPLLASPPPSSLLPRPRWRTSRALEITSRTDLSIVFCTWSSHFSTAPRASEVEIISQRTTFSPSLLNIARMSSSCTHNSMYTEC